MNVYDAVRTRSTVRSFKPNAAVAKIMVSARVAPSSRNLQPWHFVVIRDKAVLAKIDGIATSGRFVADAPMAIAVVMKRADRPELDAGRTVQQMELVAWSEGMGT